MYKLFLVGSGGFLGSVLRYVIGMGIQRILSPPAFFYGTVFVNLLGCFFIGVLYALGEHTSILSYERRLLLMVGFLGGFTTFSSFGLDFYHLLQRGQNGVAFIYLMISLFGGLLAVFAGVWGMNVLWKI